MTEAAARRHLVWVIEPTPDWEAELVRQLPGVEVRAASAAALCSTVADAVPDLIVLAGCEGMAQLVEQSRWLATAATIVILEASAADCEFALREIGVTSVWSVRDHREQVVAACSRMLRPVRAAPVA